MTRLLLLLTLATACSRERFGPRYAADIFAEDTVPTDVLVRTTGTMQASLNGAGFYVHHGQPVVLTPATLVVRGIGTATISSVDSSKPIALVPSGTHPDSTDAVTVVGRLLKVSRGEGDARYKLEIERP